MDMTSLFPSDAAAAGLQDQSGPHISFRAGILNRDAATNRVTADPRPGTLQLLTVPEDELMHLQWRPRDADPAAPPAPEHDLIVLVGQTEFKQVTSCPSAARVFVLKWREEDTRRFFWMQEKNPDRDAINVATVNAILEHGPAMAQQHVTSSPTESAATREATTQAPAADAAAATAAATAEVEADHASQAAPADGRLSDAQLAQLRTLLTPSGAGPEAAPELSEVAAAATEIGWQQREAQLTTPTPIDLLSLDVVRPALSDPAVVAALPALLAEHAPPADRHPARLLDLLRSPALRSQANAASDALLAGPAQGLLAQFGLDPGAGDNEPLGARRLLNALLALQRRANPSSGSKPPSSRGE